MLGDVCKISILGRLFPFFFSSYFVSLIDTWNSHMYYIGVTAIVSNFM